MEMKNLNIIRNIFTKKYCKKCSYIKLLNSAINELNDEKKGLQDDIKHLSLLNQLHKFNSNSENIIRIEKTYDSYFIITVENNYNFSGILSEINFYGYILEKYKENPTRVMNLYSSIIYSEKLNFVESIYIDDFIGDPDKGYGSKLMTELLNYARTLKAHHIKGNLSCVDEVDLNNKARRNHFYKKFGFKINGNLIYLTLEK